MSRVFAKLLSEDLNLGTGPATKPAPGGGTLTGTQIGIHTFSVGGMAAEAEWTPGDIPHGGSETITIAVPGARLGDFVLDAFTQNLQGLFMDSNVTGDNVVTTVLANLTGGQKTIPAGYLRLVVLHSK